jgi:hypothetical protein
MEQDNNIWREMWVRSWCPKKENYLVHFFVGIILWSFVWTSDSLSVFHFLLFFFFSGTLDKYGNLVLDSFEDDHRIVAQISFDLQLSATTC